MVGRDRRVLLFDNYVQHECRLAFEMLAQAADGGAVVHALRVHENVLEQISEAFSNLYIVVIKLATEHTAGCVSKRQSINSRDMGWS